MTMKKNREKTEARLSLLAPIGIILCGLSFMNPIPLIIGGVLSLIGGFFFSKVLIKNAFKK